MNSLYDMINIPEGPFLRGADRKIEPDAEWDEVPMTKIWLSSYTISRTPVTVGQWCEFLQDTHYSWGFQDEVARVSLGRDYPITYVSWYDCGEFTRWLSYKLHKAFSLPTEAQWEKACRGCDGQLFPWGNNRWDDTDEIVRATEQRRMAIATSKDLSSIVTQNDSEPGELDPPLLNFPVGWRPEAASPYGCLDMWMNVSEWCADWFDYYEDQEPVTSNPTGPDTGVGRVIRGGNVYSGGWPRCSHRRNSYAKPKNRAESVGFRVVALP